METWIADVIGLLVSWTLAVGPVAVAIALLNHRDRRAAALVRLAARHLPSVALRSDVVVVARARLLSPGAEVRVDMGAATREELWGALARLRGALPGHVRLRVEGRVAADRPARITVDLVGDAPAAGPTGKMAKTVGV